MTSNTTVRKILILAANPTQTTQLRLQREVRDIEEALQRAQKRDQFVLEQKWAVRQRDFRRNVLELKPQIVHFSGHGAGAQGLVLEDDTEKVQPVTTEALAALFKLLAEKVKVECVILNACYSEIQADAIVQHIDYVIGMSEEIADQAAIEFAVGFYDALADGNSVENAYEVGRTAIQMAGVVGHLIPILKKKG